MRSRVLSLLRKDAIVLKHERMLFFSYAVVVPIAALVWAGNPWFTLLFGMMPVLNYCAYVFSFDHKYGAERFIVSLAVRRKDVVLARYANIALLTLAILLLMYLINAAAMLAVPALSRPMPLGLGVFFLAFASVSVAVSLPLFFRLGYMKGRLFLTLLVMLPAVAGGVLTGIQGFSGSRSLGSALSFMRGGSLSPAAAVFLVAASLAALGLSVPLSVRFYRMKEL
jgi:hypothetical protein